jgi:hypothetical protein
MQLKNFEKYFPHKITKLNVLLWSFKSLCPKFWKKVKKIIIIWRLFILVECSCEPIAFDSVSLQILNCFERKIIICFFVPSKWHCLADKNKRNKMYCTFYNELFSQKCTYNFNRISFRFKVLKIVNKTFYLMIKSNLPAVLVLQL